jgi:hypothetical protein
MHTQLLDDPHMQILIMHNSPLCHISEPYFNRFSKLELGTLCVWHSSMYGSHMLHSALNSWMIPICKSLL